MRRLCRIVVLALLAAPAAAEEGWVFQASVGEVYNFDTSLKVHQEGFQAIDIDADYETRPFESPLYYSLRAGRWSGLRYGRSFAATPRGPG